MTLYHPAFVLSLVIILAGCMAPHARAGGALPTNLEPDSTLRYGGIGDDLLTAGLGKTGLGALLAPAFADPLHPTPAELRRNAIFNNYRAIVDINPFSGYGTLYGPNVKPSGVPGFGEGKVAGTEHITYADDGSGRVNVTLMVQVPDSFDPRQPCIVTGTSSGSSGIYGAIAVAGEWGLKHGCAVAYSDKGTGTGLYTFDDDSVNLRDGVRAARTAAGRRALFAPALSDADRGAFAAAFPDRIAFKHAHSQQNPEKESARSTLQAVAFAFRVLNARFAQAAADGSAGAPMFGAANTIVIASGVSNGAGAALRAAELDTGGLIDAVAVAEPQVHPREHGAAYTVLQGGVEVAVHSKPLFDYVSYAALYQPCIAGNLWRCAALAQKGLLSGATPLAQVADAYARMHAYGWQRDADVLQGMHAATNVLIAVGYAYSYGRFPVTEKLCGFSFASADMSGRPTPLSAQRRAQSFANQSGLPGSVIYEGSVGGPRAYHLGVSPSSGMADQSLDGFLCLRSLAIGVDAVSGAPLQGEQAEQSRRVREGCAEVEASGNLHGKPAVIVHGRSDAMVPANNAARAYVGLNSVVEGAASRLRYVEVTNANHFDIFASTLPTAIVPLQVYLASAMDAVYAHLRSGAPLPQSQLVRTIPRWSGLIPMSELNVPPIREVAGEFNRIIVRPGVVAIPD